MTEKLVKWKQIQKYSHNIYRFFMNIFFNCTTNEKKIIWKILYRFFKSTSSSSVKIFLALNCNRKFWMFLRNSLSKFCLFYILILIAVFYIFELRCGWICKNFLNINFLFIRYILFIIFVNNWSYLFLFNIFKLLKWN